MMALEDSEMSALVATSRCVSPNRAARRRSTSTRSAG